MVGCLAIGGAAGGYFFWQSLFTSGKYYSGLTAAVKKEKLRITINEEGALEAVNNTDIHCRVKTNQKGGGQIKIKWVIEDGTNVAGPSFMNLYQGEKLVELDVTPLIDEKKVQDIEVQKAKGAYDQAVKELEIVQIQNKSDIKKAEDDLAIAKKEKEKYIKGIYELAVYDIEKRKNETKKLKKDAEAELELWQDRAAWSFRMFIKGYVSESQMMSDKASKESKAREFLNLEQDLTILAKELDILNNYTKPIEVAKLNSVIAEAERTLARTQKQAAALEHQAMTDLETKKSVYDQEKAKLDEIEAEIRKAVIYAPQAGLVIYYVPPQSRFNRGSQQAIIAQGEPVEFNQKMMQIPDLSRMKVKSNIPEAMVKYVRSADPDDPSTWQPASITVDVYNDRVFKGHVHTVATIASQLDYFSSDVKVYLTDVYIDEHVKALKPGMGAKVSILAYESPEPVLTIPIQCVVGSITMEKTRKCFVVDENGFVQEREIKLGMTNERVVEIVEGLKEGEKVALDPEALLAAESPMKAARPAESRNSGNDLPGKNEGELGGPGGEGKNTGNENGGPDFRGEKQMNDAPPGAAGAPAEAQKQLIQALKSAPNPEARRDLLNKIPDPEKRKKVRAKLEGDGMVIAP